MLALTALEAALAGKIKCIYMDPPYNRGSDFAHYDESVEHSQWLSLIRDCLEILRRLLTEDGSIRISMDDNEQVYPFARPKFLVPTNSDMPQRSLSGSRSRGEAAKSQTSLRPARPGLARQLAWPGRCWRRPSLPAQPTLRSGRPGCGLERERISERIRIGTGERHRQEDRFEMTSIRKQVHIAAPVAAVWDAVRDVGAIHIRLAPGLVSGTTLEENGSLRIVTFADGLVLRERIVTVDDTARRLVWSVLGGPFEHHNASLQLESDRDGCRMVWTADLLPNDLAPIVASIMDRGLDLSKRTIEAAAGATKTATDRPVGSRDQPVFYPGARQPTLHHVSLFVSDLEASTRFYTDGLGLTVREQFRDIIGRRAAGEFPFAVASVFLEAGDGRYVELHPAGPWPMSPPGFPLNHLALTVADVDAAYARALAAGASPIDIPVPDHKWDGTPLDVLMAGDRPEPMRMAFLLGPSGELIELYQAGASSEAT